MLEHLTLFPLNFAPAAAPLFGLALVYHDIVYRAGRKDNEARSADVLERDLRAIGQDQAAVNYSRRLIMATKTHQPSGEDAGEESIMIDLDLAVLARDAAGYDAYAKAVRHEFRRYPGFLYRPGRKKALQHFLEQDHIYHTPFFRERYEDRARENLRRELQAL
ncbi:MAG: hypothetical protein AAFN92_22965 [Bacteroidota bacterium]